MAVLAAILAPANALGRGRSIEQVDRARAVTSHSGMLKTAAASSTQAAATYSRCLYVCRETGGGGGKKRDRKPPTAPTGLTEPASTTTTITAAWTASTDNVGVTGYRVFVDGTLAGTTATTTYTVGGVACGTSHQIAVDARDAAGNNSPRISATMAAAACSPSAPPGDTTPPLAPSGLTASFVTQAAVTLSWAGSQDNVGVAGYDLYFSSFGVGTTATTSHAFSGLSCNTSYTLGVDAYDAAGNKSTISTLTVTTSPCLDTSPPTVPTNLIETTSSTSSITASWTASTDNVGVTGYRVFVDGTLAGTTATTAAYTVSGLTCGTSHQILVDAHDAAGNNSSQTSATMATAACAAPPPSDTTPPSTPSGLTVSSTGQTSVALTWNASSDNVGVVGYGEYKNGTLAASPTTPGYTLTGLTCGTSYTVAVDAYDAAGNRSSKATITTSTASCPDTQAPTAPTGVTLAMRTTTSISITWTASTDNVGVAGYSLYVGGSAVGIATTTAYTFTGLNCGTNYSLGIVAYDAAGNRSTQATTALSTTTCAAPDTSPPSTPTGLNTSSSTQTGLTLNWTASTDNVGVTGYNVYLGATRVASATGTSLALSGLACGTSYTLAVDAFDAAGNTSTKASASASTAACAPSTTEPTPIVGQGYHQVFRDDFDTLNRSIWDDHIWYDGSPSPAWTNFQYAQNGVLHLVTSRNFSCGSGCNYPINTITTQTSGLTFQQGYFEARMKWTGGHGAWPGFWLYSYRHATNPSWPSINPYCSQNGLPTALCESAELDAFEGQGSEPNSFYGTTHSNSCSCYGVNDQQNGNNWRDAGVDLTAGFHTYGMLWSATQVTWYLDGQAMMSAPVYSSTNQPMFLLLQMWTGGWTYDPDSTTPTNIETDVDYVQVWQK